MVEGDIGDSSPKTKSSVFSLLYLRPLFTTFENKISVRSDHKVLCTS